MTFLFDGLPVRSVDAKKPNCMFRSDRSCPYTSDTYSSTGLIGPTVVKKFVKGRDYVLQPQESLLPFCVLVWWMFRVEILVEKFLANINLGISLGLHVQTASRQ